MVSAFPVLMTNKDRSIEVKKKPLATLSLKRTNS
jgi:hypothetical protein